MRLRRTGLPQVLSLLLSLLALVVAGAAAPAAAQPEAQDQAAAGSGPYRNTRGIPSLKEIYADKFLIGFATGLYYSEVEDLMAHLYNALTPENEMKWQSVQPAPRR